MIFFPKTRKKMLDNKLKEHLGKYTDSCEQVYRNIIQITSEEQKQELEVNLIGIFKLRLFIASIILFEYGRKLSVLIPATFSTEMNAKSEEIFAVDVYGKCKSMKGFDIKPFLPFSMNKYSSNIFDFMADEFKNGPSIITEHTQGFENLRAEYLSILNLSLNENIDKENKQLPVINRNMSGLQDPAIITC